MKKSAGRLPERLQTALGIVISVWLVSASAVLLPLHGKLIPYTELELVANLSWRTFFIGGGIGLVATVLLLKLGRRILPICLGAGVLYTATLLATAELPLMLGLCALWLVIIYYMWPSGAEKNSISAAHTVKNNPQPDTGNASACAEGIADNALLSANRKDSDRDPGQIGTTYRMKPLHVALIVAIATAQILIMSTIMVSRVRGFFTPSFDHGIFSQIFHQMKTVGSQVTTLERSYPLSHFAVHISPILYLLVPFYALAPNPETLQVLQILVVASGVIPLNLIMRKHAFHPNLRVFFSALYAFLPALNGSNMYDFHENCCLAPLLLWLFYAIERKNLAGLIVSGILLLSVKEDATNYLLFIGLWRLLNREKKIGSLMMIIALVSFALKAYLISTQGAGTLVDFRFPNLSAFPEWGVAGAVPTLLLCPGYFLSQVFTEAKWMYILYMFLPLGFTPLLQKRDMTRLVLLCPMIVLNLISSYQYLHNIYFQYHYGSSVILLYLSLLFANDVLHSRVDHVTKERYAFVAVLGLVCACSMTFKLWSRDFNIVRHVRSNQTKLAEVQATLDEIPPSASVRATTFMTTPLSNRTTLYDIRYENSPGAVQTPAEYYVFDLRYLGPAVRIQFSLSAGICQ